MKDKKDELGTINFIDIDVESGKITTTESKNTSKKIPNIIIDDKDEEKITPLTTEQEEILNGTYRENEEKRKIEREEAKIESEKSKFKLISLIFAGLVLCFCTLGIFFSCVKQAEQVKIQEKVQFLTNNASYNNNIRALVTNLRTNAVELQSSTRSSTIYKSKAKEIVVEVDKQVSSLQSNESIFKEYGASSLYDNLIERLGQIKTLAEYQKDNSSLPDAIIKTNAYITAEEQNNSSYLGLLEQYLKENKIPFSYNSGKLIYQVD